MRNREFMVGPKVNKILQKKGLKQISLIRFLLNKEEIEGKERTQFSRYLKGIHEYPIEYITITAKFLKVEPKVLLEKKSEDIPASRKIPILGFSTVPVPSASFFTDFSNVKEFMFYAGIEEKIYVLRAYDDMMEPFINEDELVLLEPVKNNQVEDGDVVHYSYKDGVSTSNDNGIRIYKKRKDGNIYLKPLNVIYNDIEVRYPEVMKMSKLVLVLKKPRRF